MRCLYAAKRFTSTSSRVLVPGQDDVGMRVDRFLSSSGVLLRDGGVRPNHALLQRWARTKLLGLRRPAGLAPVPRRDVLGHKLEPGDEIVLSEAALEQCSFFTEGGVSRNPQSSDTPARQTSAGISAPRAPAWLSRRSLLHVHAALVVLDKPAGVPVQGGTGIVTGESVDCVLPAVAALADAMLPSFVKRGPPAGSRPSLASSTLRLVHRLDREVGGVLLLARTRTAAAVLSAAFSDTSASGAQDASPSSDKRAQGAPAAPTLRKTYFAIVAAPLPPGTPSRGDIAAPVVSLDDDGSGSTGDSSSGQAAATVYSAEVLRLRPSLGPGAAAALPPAITVLHLQPLTGRKHQLRQHVLRLFGGRAAILGDARYTPLVLGGRAGRAAQGAPTAAFELVLPPASDQADPATDAGGSVSSRPASAALRRRGLPLDSGLLAGIPPSPGDAPPPAAWLCRQLCLHAHKVELGAALVDRLSPGGGDVPTASGARPQRPLVVRSPLPWPMRALLACYAEKS